MQPKIEQHDIPARSAKPGVCAEEALAARAGVDRDVLVLVLRQQWEEDGAPADGDAVPDYQQPRLAAVGWARAAAIGSTRAAVVGGALAALFAGRALLIPAQLPRALRADAAGVRALHVRLARRAAHGGLGVDDDAGRR